MKLYTCNCKWSFIIGKNRVYGPIFEDKSAEAARIMTRAEFNAGYSDCWNPRVMMK